MSCCSFMFVFDRYLACLALFSNFVALARVEFSKECALTFIFFRLIVLVVDIRVRDGMAFLLERCTSGIDGIDVV